MSTTQPPSDADLPASWDEEDADAIRTDGKRRTWWIVGAVVVVLIAVGGAFAIYQATRPVNREWPDAVGGRPAGLGGENETAADVTPTAEPGVYIWNSFDGWHLWVVNGDGLDGVSGTIKSNQDINKATSSAPDAGTATLDGSTITFDVAAGSALGGVDFDPGFAHELTFDLETADGGKVPADQVFTGSGPTPVDAVPVVIDKPVVD